VSLMLLSFFIVEGGKRTGEFFWARSADKEKLLIKSTFIRNSRSRYFIFESISTVKTPFYFLCYKVLA
jgi:hypothetical protein